MTHYQRLLNYISPDFLHVLVQGRIAMSGGKELALELETKGYDWLEKEPPAKTQTLPGLMMEAVAEDTRTTGLERSLGEAYREKRAPDDPRWLTEIRRAGMDRFLDMGFPTVHDEAWRYTNVAPIRKVPFELAPDEESLGQRSDPSPLAWGEGVQLVFINGRYSRALSFFRTSARWPRSGQPEACSGAGSGVSGGASREDRA